MDNEKSLVNKGARLTSKHDAPFYQRRIAATVGVGSYLVESALLLSKMVAKVYVIYRTARMAGDRRYDRHSWNQGQCGKFLILGS